MSLSQVCRVAENEFALTLRNPVVPVFIGLLLLICVIIAAGSSTIMISSGAPGGPLYSFLTFSIGNSYYPTYLVLLTLSVCLGVFSISDERLNGALNTLLCKPLYRTDIISGKFLGISGFILLSILFALSVLTSLTLIMFPAAGYGIIDIVERVSSYAFVLFLTCSITLALTMLIGIILKKPALSLAVSLTMAFIILYPDPLSVLGPAEILIPWHLLANILYLRAGMQLFFPSTSYTDWLIGSIPLIALLLVEIILVILANCIIFNREEGR